MNPELKVLPIPEPIKSTPRLWQSTPYSNLRRNVASGIYYAHAKIFGHLVRKSLKTDSIEVAKARLDKFLEAERKRLSRCKKLVPESVINAVQHLQKDTTFGRLADVWLTTIQEDKSLKPRAKDYRAETLTAIRSTLPWIDAMKPIELSPDECGGLAKQLRVKYSPTRFNGCLQTLRAIMALAVKRGLVADNPTDEIEHAQVKRQSIVIPTRKQFDLLLRELRSEPSRKHSYNTVRFIAYSGMRISAARQVRPEHIDFKHGEIIVPATKYQEQPIRIPMIGDMRQVCKDLLEDYSKEGPLIAIKDPRKALSTVCRKLKIPKVTTKTLRHLFTTICLESGIDVPTVARWRGDKDNGAMLLKTYSHLRDEHSHRMAKKVKF
jgi:integrase